MTIPERIFSIPFVKLVWYRLTLMLSSKKPTLTARPNKLRYFVWGKRDLPVEYRHVPRTIWSYWGGEPSECAEACRRSWNDHRAGFDIHVLTADTLHRFLPNFPDLPDGIPEQKKSNLVRLMLLERYGGIWMDYSTVMRSSIDWAVSLTERNGCEMMAFYNEFYDEYRVDHERPIIENGFLVAMMGSTFIADWRETYQNCILSKDYKLFFRNQNNFNELTSNFVQKKRDYIDYFVCYIAGQYVMLNSQNYRILMVNAEDEYYSCSYGLTPPRSKRKFAEELLLRTFNEGEPSRLVKVTGHHRAAIDEHIKYGCYRRDSIIGNYMKN